jgi:hypothetical protein
MPGQIIVSREWQQYGLVPLETLPVLLFLHMRVSGRKYDILLTIRAQITRSGTYRARFNGVRKPAELLLNSKLSQFDRLSVPMKRKVNHTYFLSRSDNGTNGTVCVHF